MEYSKEDLVKQSEMTINSIPQPACPDCQRGIGMCKKTPCIGTVDDIEKMMDAGYSKNLMLDWWTGRNRTKESEEENHFEDSVNYLLPAIKGLEMKKAPLLRAGSCSLLTSDNKCSLHDLNLKPVQGRIACCKVEKYETNYNGTSSLIREDERLLILHTWNTQRGKDLIERWKKEVNFKLEEGQSDTGVDLPNNLFETFDLLIKTFEYISDKFQTIEDDV